MTYIYFLRKCQTCEMVFATDRGLEWHLKRSQKFACGQEAFYKKKLENLSVSNNSSQSVVFEFRKERYLEGIENKEVDANMAQRNHKLLSLTKDI